MTETVNPYAAPTAVVDDVPASPEKEAIRRSHINHEASIKAVGFLYYLGGTFAALGGIFGAARDGAAGAVLLIVLAVAMIVTGRGVRAFRPWARIVGCVLAAFGLLGFPIGTIINGYILYLYLSKKGRFIFTPEYQEVIAATPHVKYKTSIVAWILLALIVGLILVGLSAALFA